ncbi:sensor histidine kinase [Nocardia tenerifensis]|uniref:sensor histidine kinase n=1 Tax=Nocardia tenerifensis TaxID=228006 RepID=UPI00031C1505|nr:histidine kinase [Nocardia tenerifensis]
MRTVAAGGQRRWRAAFPQIIDAAGPIVVTVVVLLAAHGNYAAGHKRLDLFGVVLVLVSTLPTAFRRRAPIVSLLVCCAGVTAFAAAGYWEALNVLGSLMALYSVAARYPPPISIPAAALQVAAGVSAAFGTGEVTFWVVTVLTPQFSSAAWTLGNLARVTPHRGRNRGAQLDPSGRTGARRAVVEERVRLARELNITVAQHMSSIARWADLARHVFYTDPEAAKVAVQSIENASRTALDDIRRLLTLLRLDVPGPDQAQAAGVGLGVERLGWLVDSVTAAGAAVTLSVTGTICRLTPGADLCLYRIVQESLTDMPAHARATVAVDYRAEHVVVHITGSGIETPRSRRTRDAGPGLREWAELYGGTLTMTTSSQHTFRVALTLPIMSNTVPDNPPPSFDTPDTS